MRLERLLRESIYLYLILIFVIIQLNLSRRMFFNPLPYASYFIRNQINEKLLWLNHKIFWHDVSTKKYWKLIDISFYVDRIAMWHSNQALWVHCTLHKLKKLSFHNFRKKFNFIHVVFEHFYDKKSFCIQGLLV